MGIFFKKRKKSGMGLKIVLTCLFQDESDWLCISPSLVSQKSTTNPILSQVEFLSFGTMEGEPGADSDPSST